MIKIYEVGGAVRDSLWGQQSKDVDFVMIAPSYAAMREHLIDEGFKIFVEKPEFVTIRASVPKDHPLRARTKDADFVLARKDSPTSDGRRPDYVEPGTLEDDLARRDFTINAIARDPLTDEIIDPHNGRADIESRMLRFVGDPMQRITEDGLRVLRGLRFMVTKRLHAPEATWDALVSDKAALMLHWVSIERIREEVEKMFAADTVTSLQLLSKLPIGTQYTIFRSDERKALRLSATLKE
jgi:tRNA nucleotidyltransferase/poly(A) polymerase